MGKGSWMCRHRRSSTKRMDNTLKLNELCVAVLTQLLQLIWWCHPSAVVCSLPWQPLRDFFAPSGTLQQELQLAASVSFPNQLLLEVCGNLLFDVVIFGLLSHLGICIYCCWIFWVSNLIIFWYLPAASLCYSLVTLSFLLTIYLANVFRHGYYKSFYGLYATRYIRD